MRDFSDYIAGLERGIARTREMLKPLEAGEMHLMHKEGNGPWEDTTERWIARHRENIAELEAIVIALKGGEQP